MHRRAADRFKKREAIEKAILKKTGRLMGFAKVRSPPARPVHAPCTSRARALDAPCSSPHPLPHPLRTLSAPSPAPSPAPSRDLIISQAAGVPMLVLCATAKDGYRKPATGAWRVVSKYVSE